MDTVIQPFSSYQHMLEKFGVDADGRKTGSFLIDGESDEEETEDISIVSMHGDSKPMSSMKSKAGLRRLCQQLVSDHYEKLLMTMAKQTIPLVLSLIWHLMLPSR